MTQYLLTINEKNELHIEKVKTQPAKQDIVEELRQKKSRDNRALLARAADEIERLRANERGSGRWQRSATHTLLGDRDVKYHCANCWRANNRATSYCPHCGAEMETR